MGFQHWGHRAHLSRYEAYDITRSAVLFGQSTISHALFCGRTENRIELWLREAFQFYDTWVSTILYNITVRNYNDPTDSIFSALTHSDTFRPQSISASRLVILSFYWEGLASRKEVSRLTREQERRGSLTLYKPLCVFLMSRCALRTVSSRAA